MGRTGIRTRIIVTGIIFLLLGIFIGYVAGVSWGLNFCAKAAQHYANITIDPRVITQLLIRYGANVPLPPAAMNLTT